MNGTLAYDLQENQSVVRQRSEKRTKKLTMPIEEKLFYLFSVIFIVALASIVISGYAQITEINYSIQKTEQSIEKIQKENEQLQIEIANLSAPERIIKLAQEKLNMALNEEQVIVLSHATN